jgi:hypothetical protein
VLDIHHYLLLYTPCLPSKPSACVRVGHTFERDTVLPLPFPEKVYVACDSLEAFWFYYSVLKSPEKISNKRYSKKEKQKNEAKKKTRDNIEGALCVFSFLLCGGAF